MEQWFWCSEDCREGGISLPSPGLASLNTPGGSTDMERYPQVTYQVADNPRGWGVGKEAGTEEERIVNTMC